MHKVYIVQCLMIGMTGTKKLHQIFGFDCYHCEKEVVLRQTTHIKGKNDSLSFRCNCCDAYYSVIYEG